MPPALSSKSADAATPKKGGRFRMGLTGGHTTDNLDPATLSGFLDQAVLYNEHAAKAGNWNPDGAKAAERWWFA